MIFKVQIDFRGYGVYEVEARNDEHAEELAMELLKEEVTTEYVETYDAVVTKSDNQYTDSQELEDGERRHEDKE